MDERVIIAGSGGQGIMLLGKVLATAIMNSDRSVTWLPSYGAEVRGGTAHCSVVISDAEIGSPYINKADSLIIMNAPSLQKFIPRLKPKGALIVNSSLARPPVDKKFAIYAFPFTDIAVGLGNIRVANMVALGAYSQVSGAVSLAQLLNVIEEIAPSDKKELVKINQSAAKEGTRLVNG